MIPVGVFHRGVGGRVAGRIGAGGYRARSSPSSSSGRRRHWCAPLMMAGVAGSAICTDLGSRKIREEIDAMEVMGLNVIERPPRRGIAAAIVVLHRVVLTDHRDRRRGVLRTTSTSSTRPPAHPGVDVQPVRAHPTRPPSWSRRRCSRPAHHRRHLQGLHARGGPSGVADGQRGRGHPRIRAGVHLNTILSQVYTVIVPAVGAY